MSFPFVVPVGFSDPASVNLFHAILLLGGIPLVLFVVITTLVYLPAIVRGEHVAPGHAPMENQWLGGPSTTRAELAVGSGSTSADASADSGTGGASGRW